MPTSAATPARDRGVVALFVSVLIAMAAVAGAVGVEVTVAAVDAARARTAADAAALAAVIGGDHAAARLAGRNHAELVSLRRIGDDVVVDVRLGRSMARARATDGP